MVLQAHPTSRQFIVHTGSSLEVSLEGPGLEARAPVWWGRRDPQQFNREIIRA